MPPAESPPPKLLADVLRSPDPAGTPSADTAPTKPASRELSIVFGYEVSVPTNGWQAAIPVSELGEVIDLGDAKDGKSQDSVIDELNRLATEIRFLTIVLNLTGSPDNQFVKFLCAAIKPRTDGNPLDTVVLLSGGQRLRKKLSGDSEAIHTRVVLWRQELSRCGIHADRILEFDHYTATAQSRHDLLGQFQALCLKKPRRGVADSPTVHLAGLFSKAARLIYETAAVVVGCNDADRLASETRNLHNRIHDVYQNDATWLARACAAVGCHADSIAPILNAANDQAVAGLDKLQEGATSLTQAGRKKVEELQQMLESFNRYRRGLSGAGLSRPGSPAG